MRLYRISNHADLSGKGGELADGRWHSMEPGRRVVYLADHPASCLLEALVHIEDPDELPESYQMLAIDVPDSKLARVREAALETGWRSDPSVTQKFGDAWLGLKVAQMGILVPSAIVPIALNCLLNCRHADVAKLKVEVLGRYPFDARLGRRT